MQDGEKEEDRNQQDAHRQVNPNPGNFANDPQRAAEVGRKGGQHSHGGREDET